MQKWKFAAEHASASLVGMMRLWLSRQAFASRLLGRRWHYFFRRELRGELVTPEGFLIDTPDTLIAYWSMFVEHELHETRWVRAIRPASQPLVVDVGANAGVFSHYVHTLNSTCQVVAFEPLPAMVARVRAMAARTHLNLVCHQLAVSKSVGHAYFESPHGVEGTSRLAPDGGPAENRFEVETTTLDQVLGGRKIALMKIDVEGFECDAIAGGQRALGQTDFLIVEAHSQEHLRQIEQALPGRWTVTRLGSSDYLFSRL